VGNKLPPIAEVASLIETMMMTDIEASDDDSVCLRVGDTVCQRAPGGRPRNQVIGFGERDAGRIDDILAFYDEVQLDPRFYLSPARFGSHAATALIRRGFAQLEFEQAHMVGLPGVGTVSMPSEVSVAVVTSDTVDAFVETTADGFEWDPAWRTAAIDDLRRRVAFDHTTHLLATYRGEPAGVGDVRFRGDAAVLGGGAVRPEFRRRGVHTALLTRRIALAADAGAEMVVSGASYGSASHRNQQRVGLQLAYVESTWRRVGSTVD
jgi:GNAT superfamily N-acetyltransferase